MDGTKQNCVNANVADLCAVCQNFGNVSIGEELLFGTLDDIQSRLPCKICHLVSVAIQNHRSNRPHESQDNRCEVFLIVPQHTSPSDEWKPGYACICHFNLRIDSRLHSPHRSIGIIRHTHRSCAKALPGEKNCEVASVDVLDDLKRGVEHHEGGSSLSVPMLRSWLQTCEVEHDRCNMLPDGSHRTISRLLLIDVDSMCLVEAATPRYFALSYVWGTAKVLMTLKSSYSKLTQPGALNSLGEEVPLLIRDVILFMQQLGERYLWVDSLCIVQDDDSTKLDLIGQMDRIYGEAVCTIVAHGSLNVSSPLPGVRRNTRRPYRLTTAGKIIGTTAGADEGLLICSPSHYTAYPSVYDTRGWTFQEQLLPRRRLIFGADQVFFSCHTQAAGDWCEDPLTDLGKSVTTPAMTKLLDSSGSPIAIQPSFNPDLTGMRDTWKTRQAILSIGQFIPCRTGNRDQMKEIIYIYTSAVTYYSTRRLSFPSDILNAFSGILSAIERSYGFRLGSSVYGLLESYFIYNLLFIAKTPGRRQGWPSWSWVGWSSQIYFLERNDPDRLHLQVQNVYVAHHGEIRMLTGKKTPSRIISSGQVPDECDIPQDRLDQLLQSSARLPLLSLWAIVAAPGALRIRYRTIRQTKVRIWQNDEQCGHVHEEFDYADTTYRPTDEEWDSYQLVYLAHSPRRCVFHIYADCECAGTCNMLVVDPGDAAQESEYVHATRIAMAEVCGNTWRDVATTLKFMTFA